MLVNGEAEYCPLQRIPCRNIDDELVIMESDREEQKNGIFLATASMQTYQRRRSNGDNSDIN